MTLFDGPRSSCTTYVCPKRPTSIHRFTGINDCLNYDLIWLGKVRNTYNRLFLDGPPYRTSLLQCEQRVIAYHVVQCYLIGQIPSFDFQEVRSKLNTRRASDATLENLGTWGPPSGPNILGLLGKHMLLDRIKRFELPGCRTIRRVRNTIHHSKVKRTYSS